MEQLSFQSLSVLGWLFESTIYISILICLIFIIKAFIKRKLPAWWSYCLWLLLLVRMLIPFGVETPVSVYNYVPAPSVDSLYMPYLVQHKINIPFIQYAPDTQPDFSPDAVPVEADLPERPLIEQHDTHESITTDTSSFNLSLDRALFLFWIAGVLVFGIATIYKNCKFWLIVRREQTVNDKDILDLFNECRSTLGVQKNVEIIVTGSVKSPAIFGYFKPQLLLPPHFLETLNKDELHCIFMHELGHVKRHDIGVSWLATLFQVIYWFNPLIWYAFHHLRADQEAACDAYVLSKIKQVRPTDYARTIVNLLQRFVQNRQLPSLAGIIENKSQIDRRITMILDYKRITLKKTFVSVLMLFIMICAFFACSTGRLADRKPGETTITRAENSDMNHYKNDDWNFSVDIPRNWSTSPSLPVYLVNVGQPLISFGTNDDGFNALLILTTPHDPELSLNEELDRIKKQLANDGCKNFISTETTIGSRKALILDLDKEVEDGILHAHAYLIPYHSVIYALGFVTTRTDPTIELYDRIAETFELHEMPVARGIKKYVSPDGEISLEIPAHWITLPGEKKNGETVSFATQEDGLIATVYNPSYIPNTTLEERRANQQEIITRFGWKDFTNSEAVIGQNTKALIFDSNSKDGLISVRDYFFEDGDYKYMVAFYTHTKDSIPPDRLEVYDRVMKSFKFRKKPAPTEAGMKEYTGPNLEKPVGPDMKRYVSPDGIYTVDIPDHWLLLHHEKKYSEIGRFVTSENGLTAIFYPPAYLPWQSLEERREEQVKINTNARWKNFIKSDSVIDGRKTLIFDCDNGYMSLRDYFFEDAGYKYLVAFFANTKDGIPSDKLEEYNMVMKSINIIKANSEFEVMKEYTGPDLEKSAGDNMKRYVSPDGDYTVDIPDDWYPYPYKTDYGQIGKFGASGNGPRVTFYAPAYNPMQSIEDNRDDTQERLTKFGWKNFNKSETVINGRKTFILDYYTDAVFYRNYYFDERGYRYTTTFDLNSKDGIPFDKLEKYEQIMNSINIVRGNPKGTGFKENAGQYLEKPTESGIASAYPLPVQFRFGENEPGRDLEEMTVSGSDRKVYLHKESVLSNADIMTAVAQNTGTDFGISVTFTEAGGKKLAEITKNNMGKILGIVLDGKLINAPVIRAQITGGKAFIEGKFTLEEAVRFARGIVGEK